MCARRYFRCRSSCARVDHAESDQDLPARRQRLPVRRRSDATRWSKRCSTAGGRRRAVRRHRPQPGLDDRLRRAAAARSGATSKSRCSSPSARRSACRRCRTCCGTGPAATLPFPPCVKRWVNVADRLDPGRPRQRHLERFRGNDREHVGSSASTPTAPRHPAFRHRLSARPKSVRHAGPRRRRQRRSARSSGRSSIAKDLADEHRGRRAAEAPSDPDPA